MTPEGKSLNFIDENSASIDAHAVADNSLMILPPSQTISESLTALAHSTSKELERIWDEIGLSPDERADQLTDLLSSFRKACDDKVTSEREVAENYRQMIVDYKKEIRSTCTALKIPPDENLLKEDSGQTLQDEVYTLELALEDLRRAAITSKKELVQYRDQLMEDHEALGISMDEEWKDIESDLTQPRVKMFQDKVKEMETIVSTRTSAVIQLIRDSQELIDVLRIDPNKNLLDRKIMGSLFKDENDGSIKIVSKFETDDCTGISAGTLQALTDRVRELHSEKRRRKSKLSEMGAVIGELWEKLHVPKEEQNAFAQSIDGLGLDTLEKGEKEIARLYALKEVMMGRLIVEARKKIESLWDQTNATDEQKAAFHGMHVNDESLLNDDLLSQHEEYIQSLEKKLEHMRPILEVIEKREAIIQERMEYEEFLKDPTRLQQRGSALTRQLMKEEKMSRRIKKDLPKYTDHLNKKLRDWACAHGEAFLYKGQDYLSLMKEQEDEWQEYKENQAQLKRQKKQQEKSFTSGGFLPQKHTTSGVPLQDTTNNLCDIKTNQNKMRPLSRFRALSRGRDRTGKTNETRAESRPRSIIRARSKSKGPVVRDNKSSRGRGIFSRGRAQPVERS
jgi:protein regulator of cytokinesis 1